MNFRTVSRDEYYKLREQWLTPLTEPYQSAVSALLTDLKSVIERLDEEIEIHQPAEDIHLVCLEVEDEDEVILGVAKELAEIARNFPNWVLEYADEVAEASILIKGEDALVIEC